MSAQPKLPLKAHADFAEDDQAKMTEESTSTAAPEEIADFVENDQAAMTEASTPMASGEGGKVGAGTPKNPESESEVASVAVRAVIAARAACAARLCPNLVLGVVSREAPAAGRRARARRRARGSRGWLACPSDSPLRRCGTAFL